MDLSVIISTYNPNPSRLSQTIEGLSTQIFDDLLWELIIVDNNSSFNILEVINLNGITNVKIVVELKQGLTYARLKGFNEASGNIIIMVDDDNILAENYIQLAFKSMQNNPSLGALGGKSLPVFEEAPPAWLHHFHSGLALRDLGNEIQIKAWENDYPNIAPIGAGMVIRKEALKSYIENLSASNYTITDRTPTSLSSGGDNEIIITILKSGWQVAYIPELRLHHIIPAARMDRAYLARLLYATNKSWVILLHKYQLNPWKKSNLFLSLLKKIKAYFSYKAWQNETQHIKWKGACGLFDGMTNLR